MVSQPCTLERPYALGTSIKQNSLEFTEFASWVLQRILTSQRKLRYRKLRTCWQEGEHPPLAHVDYISSSASHRKPLHNESLRKEGLLIFMKVSFLHTSFPRQSCHTALVAAPAQAPARWWDLRRAVQDTTIWNSFLAWAMSTGTGNPPGSFLTCMLEFPGLQEGLAAQPAANMNLQIYWSLLNWLQVSAQLPQKGVSQLQGWNFMSRKFFCGGTGEKKAPAWSFWGTCIGFRIKPNLIGVPHQLLQNRSFSQEYTSKGGARKLSCFKKDLGWKHPMPSSKHSASLGSCCNVEICQTKHILNSGSLAL